MSNTVEVIIVKSDGKLQVGKIVKVASGYARNYLIPKQLAQYATPENIAAFEAKQQTILDADKAALEKARALHNSINYGNFPIVVSGSQGDKIFGSIGKRQIATALQAAGHEITAEQILDFGKPIQKLGNYDIGYRLRREVVGKFTINVVRDAPEASYVSEQESIFAGELDWKMLGYPAIIVAPAAQRNILGDQTLLEPIDAATAAKAISRMIGAFKDAGVLSCARPITASHLEAFVPITEPGIHDVNIRLSDSHPSTYFRLVVASDFEWAKQMARIYVSPPPKRELEIVSNAALNLSGGPGG